MRNVLALLVFGLMAFSCQSAKDEYLIKGSISGVDKGKVYLMKIVGNQPQAVDSTDISGGKFSFKGKMEIPEMRVLRLNQKDYFAQFFLDNSNITIASKKDSLRATTITGSPTQDIMKIFIEEMERINKEVSALQQKYQAATASNNSNEAGKARADYEALIANNKVFIKNFVREHSNSVVGAFVLGQFVSELDGKDVEELIGKLSPEIDKSEYVIQLKQVAVQLKQMAEAEKITEIGAVAPDFTMNDTEGKPLQLSSLRGQIVLVDFWASWCGPCRQENPNVVKAYQQFHPKGFEILGVSLDRGKPEWLNAIKADNLSWKHVSDLQYWQNAAARLYGVNSIPASFLLDKDGKIIAKNLRGEELSKKLAELFPN